MSDALKQALARHREDYTRVKGAPFKNFFCPILHVDEPAELALGHVVNKSLGESVGARAVQRKDVDGFYGRVVEADFQALVMARSCKGMDYLIDPRLEKKVGPQITLDGEPVGFHRYRGHEIPPRHAFLRVEGEDGSSADFVLRRSFAEVEAHQDGHWSVVLDLDGRVAAIASLIKAAHLTLFQMCGYNYALSLPGWYVGRQILGRFFLDNSQKSSREAKEAARTYFPQFANMVRPVEEGGDALAGTVEDGQVVTCHGSSGRAFAVGVYVRTNSIRHAVLIPNFCDPDCVQTYLDFLQNGNEFLTTQCARFNRDQRCWEGSGTMARAKWPKNAQDFVLG